MVSAVMTKVWSLPTSPPGKVVLYMFGDVDAVAESAIHRDVVEEFFLLNSVILLVTQLPFFESAIHMSLAHYMD